MFALLCKGRKIESIVNTRDSNGESLITFGTMRGTLTPAYLTHLLKSGVIVPPEIVSSFWQRSIRMNDIQLAPIFIKWNVPIDQVDLEGRTPLFSAITSDNQEKMAFFIEHGAQPRNINEWLGLLNRCMKNHKLGALVYRKVDFEKLGWKPIHFFACIGSRHRLCQELRKNASTASIRCNGLDKTPLELAIEYAHPLAAFALFLGKEYVKQFDLGKRNLEEFSWNDITPLNPPRNLVDLLMGNGIQDPDALFSFLIEKGYAPLLARAFDEGAPSHPEELLKLAIENKQYLCAYVLLEHGKASPHFETEDPDMRALLTIYQQEGPRRYPLLEWTRGKDHLKWICEEEKRLEYSMDKIWGQMNTISVHGSREECVDTIRKVLKEGPIRYINKPNSGNYHILEYAGLLELPEEIIQLMKKRGANDNSSK
ncbi:MAG: hypothetical protein JSS61_02630 [Verrucomicrobia bacterium]|nr:hypothetical protein [Verrucomicrobiota bacterium]